LSKGSANILIETPEGQKKVAEVGYNDYIGEIALFSGEKRTASVQANEEVEVLELSVDTLKKVIHYSPSISFDMMRQMTLRLLEQKKPKC
jgi:CRP-like cAMP-binding protein